jgi:MFS superfamily sulfate permease-like transporter
MPNQNKAGRSRHTLQRFFPFLTWFDGYSVSHLRADFIAGLTVALVLVPQSMAYAQLAGLPPYYGLYAAFLPPTIAVMFGSSYQLATGPVAIVSLMTATALEPLATAGSTEYLAYAIVLALIVGVFQFALGILRLGLIVNLLSHPVVTGFTNAAALIIATSQLSKLFGVYVDKGQHHYETVFRVVGEAIRFIHWPTLGLGVLAFALMIGLKRISRKIPYVLVAAVVTTVISYATKFEQEATVDLEQIGPPSVRAAIEQYNRTLARKSASANKRVELSKDLAEARRTHEPRSVEVLQRRHELALLEVQMEELEEEAQSERRALRRLFFHRVQTDAGSTRFVLRGHPDSASLGDRAGWRPRVGNQPLETLTLMAGGAIVGKIPAGLPALQLPMPTLSLVRQLIVMAAIISLLGFMEAISIAKAMAARTGQRLDPNQELIGQGLANIIGSIGQSYPVSGSFSRSAVNLSAGGVTGLSNVISSGCVLITLLFLTPLLYHLPQSVLAAIIMMAVLGLVNVRGFIHHWRAQRSEGIVAGVTFVSTLALAPHLDRGIMIGVVLTIGIFLLRTMKPEIAILSKHSDGAYRSAERHGLEICQHIAVIRFNGSLFFASVNYLEEAILERIASMPEVKHILIVGNGINEIDASGEEMLSQLIGRLREAGYDVSFSGLNDAVLDVMKRTGLYENIGEDNFYPNVVTAVDLICFETVECSQSDDCPLKFVRFKKPEGATDTKPAAPSTT